MVVLTTYDDDESILAALRAGARGYLTKDAGSAQLAQAIRAAATGQAVLSQVVQTRLVAAASAGTGTAPASPSAPAPLPDGLTPREADVLRLIATGKSNTEIAAALYVTEATVKSHINHLFAKAGVRDRGVGVGVGAADPGNNGPFIQKMADRDAAIAVRHLGGNEITR